MIISNNHPHQSKFIQLVQCFLLAALAGVIAFVLHESAHFLTAKLFDASNVIFHWGSVEYDTSSVSNIGNGLIAFGGPIFSYLIVAAAWLYGRDNLLVLALGFSAAFRGVVLIPFVIKSLLGRDTSTFYFDEILGANAFGISAFIPVAVSLTISVISLIYFARNAKRKGGIIYMIVMMVGTIAGVYAWSLIGGVFFPGGYGFN